MISLFKIMKNTIVTLFLLALVLYANQQTTNYSTNQSSKIPEGANTTGANHSQSRYIEGISEVIHDKWNDLSNLVSSFFTSRNDKNLTEDITTRMKKFSENVNTYFQKHYPKENLTTVLEAFGDQLNDFLRRANISENWGGNFTSKFYDFTDNITDFLHHGNLTNLNLTQDLSGRFINFTKSLNDYFGMKNYSNYQDYIRERYPDYYRTFRSRNSAYSIVGPDKVNFYFHSHEHYPYAPGYEKFSRCNDKQTSFCIKTCRDRKQAPCGCYIPDENSNVDCMCAENSNACFNKIKSEY